MSDAGLPGWHREVLGDVVRDERWLLAARLPILGWRWHLGAAAEAPNPGEIMPGSPTAPATGKADLIMDLQADKQVPLSGAFTDETGNPVPPPDGATVTYTVDDATVINLTDNGDGTAVAAATGALGAANVHAEAAFDGHTASGDLQIVVVAGDAERFQVVAGDPVEVTPDT